MYWLAFLGVESREAWWSPVFHSILKKIHQLLSNYLKDRAAGVFGVGEFKLTVELNRNLALFVRDLLSICDRGVCIEMVCISSNQIFPFVVLEWKLSDFCLCRFEIIFNACNPQWKRMKPQQNLCFLNLVGLCFFFSFGKYVIGVWITDYLKIISDYVHFIPLNLPLAYSASTYSLLSFSEENS